jgi:deoxyribodipyrimidine photo-lyase
MGLFSVRQIYNKALPVSESFISELAWREFWQHIAYYFPETKELEFQEKRRHISWEQENEHFQKWCQGETGYPIVDAAMKQLLETNWMHGRARMIVASFLTKDLHIDWRLGEKHFKKYLLDYDENVNIGNWQWSASV